MAKIKATVMDIEHALGKPIDVILREVEMQSDLFKLIRARGPVHITVRDESEEQSIPVRSK